MSAKIYVPVLLFFASAACGLPVISALGLVIVSYSIIKYVEAIGSGFAILELAFMLASIQWLLGPIIAYHCGGEIGRYRMYVDEGDYMRLAVPATLAFAIGLFSLFGTPNFHDLVDRFVKTVRAGTALPVVMIVVGALAGSGSSLAPSSLQFVLFMVSQFQFIGVIHLILARNRYRWAAATIVFLFNAYLAVDSGLFHTILLWAALTMSFALYHTRITLKVRYLMFLAAVGLAFVLQQIKQEYRSIIWDDRNTAGEVGAFARVLYDYQFGEEDTAISTENLDGSLLAKFNVRLNEGWVISAVMRSVPRLTEFADGRTVWAAISDSAVPRFLVPKDEVRVQDAFKEFTGLDVGGRTSIGISPLGEGWANFGWGAIPFMAIWGAVLALSLRFLSLASRRNPGLILWAPLIFLQAVKAETELVVVLNHLVKAGMFVATVFLIASLSGVKKSLFGGWDRLAQGTRPNA